jgi:Flp pilus assembly protein TadG
MFRGSLSKKRQRGATIILLLAMLPLLLLPLIGLAIDGTRLYIVQSKLSAAADGAALGAGRLLGTSANTTEIATEFLNVNFPSHFWSTSNLQSNITYRQAIGSQTIVVYATVTLPLTFARLLGQSASLVSASSVATRGVRRIEIVLDRSGSMDRTDPATGQNVFDTMKAGAQWFASQFTPGYDEVGLVVFGGTSVVAYPTHRPWDPSPAGVGGPDKTFSTNPQTQVGQIFDQLTAMDAGGGTGTPEALAQAFVELQKTHNRDLASDGFDNTLNTIVLFTDGVPDAIATYLNDPANNALRAGTCTNNPATGSANTQMRGYIVAAGSPKDRTNSASTGWGGTVPGSHSSTIDPTWGNYGLLRLASYDTSLTLTQWLGSTGSGDFTKGNPNASLNGCANLQTANGSGNPNEANNDMRDLGHIPYVDVFGYSTGSSPVPSQAYKNSLLSDGTHTWSPNLTITYDPNTPNNANNIAAASWNLTDNIGKAIRTQTIANMQPIQIFTIGYSGNGGTDIGLLKRLANTTTASGNTTFVPTEPIGNFYLVNSTADLQAAFDAIASTLLRLAY